MAAGLEQYLRNFPPLPGEAEDLVRLRAEAYARLDVASIVGFYKANWPWSPVTHETEGFGFQYGAFPLVKSPTLFIYGKDSAPFTNQTLNDMWEWVDDDLAIHVLAGVGHDLHREAPEVVTPIILEWLDRTL